MLTPREKEEMLEDGRDPKRRLAFAMGLEKARRWERRAGLNCSLDHWLRFVSEFQKVFPPGPLSRKKTITDLNKL